VSIRKETKLDPDKFLNPERIRINLLLSSLYLSAFEILKTSIIDSIKGFFVLAQEMTDEQAKELKDTISEDAVNRIREQYSEQVEEYERQVGAKFDGPDQYALIPSCRWLQKMGALEENEIDAVKQIRDHRNEIAHELPSLLIGEGININVNLFQRIRELLRKIDVFWARTGLQFDLETLNEINMDDIRDEDILSGREIMLNVIADTVADYLNQLAGGSVANTQAT